MVILWDPLESGENGERAAYSSQMKVSCVCVSVCLCVCMCEGGGQAFGGSGSYQWSLAEKNSAIAVNSGGVAAALMQGSSSVQVTE